MRTLIKVSFPPEASNAAVTDGRLAKVIQKTIASLNPEATYFYTEDGNRGAMFVFDLKETSDIPWIAEPLFMEMNASVHFFPVMNLDELVAGLEKAAKNA